jgi:hypothetical protein
MGDAPLLGHVSMPPIPRPVADAPEVRALCERLVPGTAPFLIEVDDPPPPGAEPNDCTANIERVIEAHGGGIEYGWQLWETLPGVMIEAEFHAVWIDAAGTRRDVTPKAFGITRIVFLPDPNLVYEGRQIDNVRVALRDDPLIHQLIEAAEQYYEATNRGELADFHGDLVLTPEMRGLLLRRLELERQIVQKYFAV